MEASELNPVIRYSDLRLSAVSYKTLLCAYDYRLFSVKDGECTAVVDGREVSLCKHSCLVIPPGVPYRFIFNERAPALLYNLNFGLHYLPGNGRAIRPDPPERFHPQLMPEAPDPVFFPVPTLIENAPEIASLAADILEEREKRELYFNETCSAIMKQILLRLLRLPKFGEKPMPATVKDVQKYLKDHCCESITGEQLGKLFGYHPFYLNRLFRDHTGQTIHLYQMQCRMKIACVLLTTTLHSVKEISNQLGFSSPSYFCEMFKKLRGVSPLDYRDGMR